MELGDELKDQLNALAANPLDLWDWQTNTSSKFNAIFADNIEPY
jgi:hypothetical protein